MNARELTNRLADLLRNERHAMADFLVALADFDRTRQWLELSHRSLFDFLRRELGLSTGSAFFRKTAAALIQEFPEIVEPLREGKLCLTTVVELSKVLTRENLPVVLPRFFHLSKQAAKEVAVELKPEAAPQRTVVTAARAPAAQAHAIATTPAPAPNATESHPFRPDETVRAKSERPTQEGCSFTLTGPAPAPMTVEPKNAEQSRLHLTVTREFLRKLDAARDALSHSRPGASEQEILEAGLDLVLERSAKRKGLVKKPRAADLRENEGGEDQQRSRYIPAAIRRAVWERDGGRCQVPLEGRGVCGSTFQVELDHIIPWAKGGKSTVTNLRCACRAHNGLAAREAYGNEVMDRYTGGPLRVKEATVPYGAGA
jgi:hypothetical protein